MDTRRLFRRIFIIERIREGTEIASSDELGQLYFYIVLKGFVKECFFENGIEITSGFYFENDFFGSFYNSNPHQHFVFKAMEPVQLYKIYWDDWKSMKAAHKTINEIWIKMIEARLSNSVNWEEFFKNKPMENFMRELKFHQPMAFKNDRLSKIIESIEAE